LSVSISMHLVVFGLIAALAILCAVVYATLRNQSASIWLAAALGCGGIETVVLTSTVRTDLAVAAVSCLVPGAYLCLSQSIRALLRLPGTDRRLIIAVSALTLSSLVLLAAGAGALLQSLPFQIAGALALADGILCLYRKRARDILDTALLGILLTMAFIVFARMPVFPLLFDPQAMDEVLQQSTLQRWLLGAAMITTPASVLIMIAKIVLEVIASHRERSERDYLTNLMNRRSFERVSSGTTTDGGAVIVCDIDHFKSINDRYGHATGDDIIRVFASLLHGLEGLPARVGGEEFALLLPGATEDEACVIADAIRERFHALRHPTLHGDHRLSASFGVAGFAPGETLQNALVHADRALYRAKDEGRNRVASGRTGPMEQVMAGVLRTASAG